MPGSAFLSARGGPGASRAIRLILRVVFVRFLFHTLGFGWSIVVLLALGAGIYLWSRRRR